MRDACVSAGERNLAELVEDGGGRCVDEGVEDRDREDRAVAFRNLPKHGDLGFFEFGERHHVDPFDLLRVGSQGLAGLGPDHHGRHAESGSGGKIVELAEDVGGIEAKSDFFMGLAEGGVDDGFAGVEAPARKGKLARMMAKGGAAGDEERGLAMLVSGDDEGDGCGFQGGVGLRPVFEGIEVLADSSAQGVVEGSGSDRHECRA